MFSLTLSKNCKNMNWSSLTGLSFCGSGKLLPLPKKLGKRPLVGLMKISGNSFGHRLTNVQKSSLPVNYKR